MAAFLVLNVYRLVLFLLLKDRKSVFQTIKHTFKHIKIKSDDQNNTHHPDQTHVEPESGIVRSKEVFTRCKKVRTP